MAGEDDDGDCVLGGRAYGLGGQDGDNVPADKIPGGGGVLFTVTAASQVYKQMIEFCTWAGLSAQIESSVSRQPGVFRGPGSACSGT